MLGWLILVAVAAGAWFVTRPSADGGGLLTLYGNVEIRDARLAFGEQELVAAVEVEEGATVHAGEVLARLRGERLGAELEGAVARRSAAEQVLARLMGGIREQEIAQVRA